MDTRANPPIRRLSLAAKRPQKYLHFALLPGDEEFIAQLSAAQQEALRLEGSYASRAREKGVPIGTIRSRLHRARSAIARMRENRERENSPEPDPLH